MPHALFNRNSSVAASCFMPTYSDEVDKDIQGSFDRLFVLRPTFHTFSTSDLHVLRRLCRTGKGRTLNLESVIYISGVH